MLLWTGRVCKVAPKRAVQRRIRIVRSGDDGTHARKVLLVVFGLGLSCLTVLVAAKQVLRRRRGGRLRRGGRECGGKRGAVLPRRWRRVRHARVDGAWHADRGGRKEVRACDGDEDLPREWVQRGAVGERFAGGAADEGLRGAVSMEWS